LRVVGGTYEPGWTANDNEGVAPTDERLLCDPITATWSLSPAETETLPINCANWAEAKAFCIWDGGFLPSEAEWEYAAAGGDEQRMYPWGASPPGVDSEYAIYGCLYPLGPVVPGSLVGVCSGGNLPSVGTALRGVGRWGQLDLGGSLWEWTLDSSETDTLSQTYLDLCSDCVDLRPARERLVRGGQYENADYTLQPTFRRLANASERYPGVGFRCARQP
jgi:formylglycine-generating enzyme required for sulfatase activity